MSSDWERGGVGGAVSRENIPSTEEVAYPLIQSMRGWRTLSEKNSGRVRSSGRLPAWRIT